MYLWTGPAVSGGFSGVSKMAKAKNVTVPSKGVQFIVTGAARPGAGGKLAAYTSAWMELTGFAGPMGETGAMIPKAVYKDIAGQRAYDYHIANGNIEQTDKGVRLTEQGALHFAARALQIDHEARTAYVNAMTTGQPDGAFIKNPEFIKAAKR